MEISENTTTMFSPSPRRRKNTAGSCDSENTMTKFPMNLPSPRMPLRALSKNSLDDLAVMAGEAESAKNIQTTARTEGNSTPSPAFSKTKTPGRTPSCSANGICGRAPKQHTPSSVIGRTPNAGKILSPLPLQPRTLHTSTRQKVEIEMGDYLFRDVNNATTKISADHDANTGGVFDGSCGQNSECDDNFYALKMSKTFDEDDENSVQEGDSIGGGFALDDFKFIRKLGCGGTADVYEVLDTASCALYALKVQKATEDALCELDLHIPLRHKNICQMVDYFYSDTKPFAHEGCDVVSHEKVDASDGNAEVSYLCTILEICDNGDLARALDEYEMIPEKLAATYVMDIINALTYLHSRDMIHCDIKPANCLLDGNGKEAIVKLADFGMAVTADAKEIVGGSPVYMAPEHLLAWRDMTDNFDHTTDIYSLGVVLYELLLGYLPYEVLEAEQKVQQIDESSGDSVESITKSLMAASVTNGDTINNSIDCGYPVLDLRKLNDASSDKPFYIPPPIFIEEISDEAQDLILRLMEPTASKRITLEEAKDHEWFKKFL